MKRLAVGLAVAVTLATQMAAQPARLLLEELSWTEVEVALEAGVDTAIVTVGATEQHGPHLALASDSVTADRLGPEIATRLGRALVAPPIRIGVSPHHMLFAGTLTARAPVLAAILREYVHSLAWHGFRHVILIPTHGGNFTTVGEVDRQLSPLYPHVNIVGYADAQAYIATLQATSERLGVAMDAAGSHAGLSETAMVLATRPDLVQMPRAAQGFMGDAYGAGDRMNAEGTQAISPIGVLGDPRAATAEQGQAYLEALAAHLTLFARTARDGWSPAPLENLPYGGLPDPAGPLAEGVRLRRAGDHRAASAFFRRALEHEPGNTAAALELARTSTLAGDMAAARHTVEPLVGHADPRVREQAHDELALLDLYQGRFASSAAHKRAARAILTAAGDRQGEARKLFYVGYVQTEIRQFDEAAATYAEALRLAPEVSEIHLDLQHLTGLLEVARGRLARAIEPLRAIADAAIEPRWAAHVRRFYHLHGEILLARGRVEDALRSIAPAIAIYDHPLYREALGRAYWRAGRAADAEQQFARLLALQDARLDIPIHYVKTHLALARLHEAAGRHDEARRMYTRFLEFWGKSDVPLPSVAEARAALARPK